MAGFFSKKQYAAIADKELAIKLLNERCLECSICAMFFNSSLTVSIKTLFLSRILSAHSFPLMFSRNVPCFNGSRSSTFPGVNIKLRISPLSLIIRCNLNPKNYPIEHFPRSASPSNVLWIRILWLRQTRKGVESTKLMPVHVPSRTFLMKMAIGSSTSFSNSTKRL